MNIKSQYSVLKFIIPIAICLFITACGGGSKSAPERQGVESYPVLKIQRRSIVLTNSYPATLKGSQTIEIRPKVQGYITNIPVHEGDIVNKGEVLFQLRKDPFQQNVRSARADVQSAKASVQTAKDNVKRIRNLVQQNIVSNYELRSAKDDLQTAKAKLAQAKATLKNAEINLNYTTIRSPVHGSIGTIPYRVGSLVSSTMQQPLTTVSDISTMFAYFSMSEQQLLHMSEQVAKEGDHETLQQRITDMPHVRLLLPDSTVYPHTGRLQLASGQISTTTGAASLKAIFSNPEGVLRSGSSGEVQIPDSLHSAIVVPKRATYEIQNKTFVYTVTDSNTVQSKSINIQPLSTKKLYVVSGGLKAGSRIVLEGINNLQDNMKISPQSVNADSLYNAFTVKDQNNQ
ncbi:MAG TPA: efflux RND transporter periplasmic adaptor subunit [Balneolaceae bacterium]|nr:efflux RND transporter periplasmic adaptor subunit [Balneolaceae bacterium]